jgi:hypothetical protein
MFQIIFPIDQVAYVKYICPIYVYTDIYEWYVSVLDVTSATALPCSSSPDCSLNSLRFGGPPL